MASTAENESSLIEKVSLIDILYKDEYRIDSYLAQIMKGVLKRRKVQETNSRTDTKEMGGSIKIFSGNFVEGGTQTTMEETRFVPHDRNVNDLLTLLALEPQENLSSEEIVGRLVCLKGRLSVRDFRKFTEIISVMAENNEMFNVDKKEATKMKKSSEMARWKPLALAMERKRAVHFLSPIILLQSPLKGGEICVSFR